MRGAGRSPARGAIVGVAVAVGATILAGAPGDLGFQGAVDQDTYDAIRDELNLPATFDPTLFISMNDTGPAVARTDLGVGEVARQFAAGVVGVNPFGASADRAPAEWLLVGPTIVALGLILLLVLRGPPDLRVVAVMSAILAVGLLAVGIVFALRYDVFALEYFGNRRVFSYATIPFVSVGVAAAEAGTRWLGRGRIGERGASIVACVCVLLTAVVLLPLHRIPVSIPDRAAELALLERVARDVPCDGRVLATHRTLGTFQTIAGHAGVLEGMGPHVRPSVLRLAVGRSSAPRRSSTIRRPVSTISANGASPRSSWRGGPRRSRSAAIGLRGCRPTASTASRSCVGGSRTTPVSSTGSWVRSPPGPFPASTVAPASTATGTRHRAARVVRCPARRRTWRDMS